MNLKFKLDLIKQVNRSSLSFGEKVRLRQAIMWRPDVVEYFKMEMESAYSEENPAVSAIDWENFDWEAAAEFWVKVIESIAKIIIAVI